MSKNSSYKCIIELLIGKMSSMGLQNSFTLFHPNDGQMDMTQLTKCEKPVWLTITINLLPGSSNRSIIDNKIFLSVTHALCITIHYGKRLYANCGMNMKIYKRRFQASPNKAHHVLMKRSATGDPFFSVKWSKMSFLSASFTYVWYVEFLYIHTSHCNINRRCCLTAMSAALTHLPMDKMAAISQTID